MEPTVWLDEAGPFGARVGVFVPLGAGEEAWGRVGALHAGEIAAASAFGRLRRAEWLLGRLALRRAVARLGGAAPGPLLAGPRGAPGLPAGVSGSLSHKRVGQVVWAVALVAFADEGTLGVDLEVDVPGAPDVLTFALKEAAGKALDPVLGRFVAPDELDVEPHPDGTAGLTWVPPAGARAPDVALRWERRAGLLLAEARVPPSLSPRHDS